MPYYFFQWTAEIIEHLAENGVSPEEFEAVVCNPTEATTSRSSGRPAAIGDIAPGRRLFCVYELLDDKMTVIPVTAYEVE